MIIKLFMGIFILVLLTTAWYLWRQRNSRFLAFNTQDNPELSKLMSFTALSLLAESIIGIAILIWGDKYLNLVTLVLACASILFFGLQLNQKNE